MNDKQIDPDFFTHLVAQHRDAHGVIETAIVDFANRNWDTVGSRDPKPTWSPFPWLEGWDVVDSTDGPIIHASFFGNEDEPSILSFPVAWLDFYPTATAFEAEPEPEQHEGRKVGIFTVIK